MSSVLSQRLSKENNTNSDSVINLTKPALYSIYQNQDIDDDSNDMYTNLQDDIKRDKQIIDDDINHKRSKSLSSNGSNSGSRRQRVNLLKIIRALIVLSVLGNLYITLVEKLHYANPILPNLTTYKIIHLLNITSNKSKFISTYSTIYNQDLQLILNNSIEGIILGSIQPIFDRLIFQNLNISTDPLFKNNGRSILRLFISFIGISYLLKKTEWNSSLQASEVWSFLNPLIWLLLDTTLTGFVSASFVSICAMIGYLLTLSDNSDSSITSSIIDNLYNLLNFNNLITNEASDLLWIGSFIFIGLIIFGKIGRYLYN